MSISLSRDESIVTVACTLFILVNQAVILAASSSSSLTADLISFEACSLIPPPLRAQTPYSIRWANSLLFEIPSALNEGHNTRHA